MSCYIQVAEDESEEPIELPTEDDSSLLLSTLGAQFPGVSGLKYRALESRTLRGVRLLEGRFQPPEEGWGNHIYVCVFPKGVPLVLLTLFYCCASFSELYTFLKLLINPLMCTTLFRFHRKQEEVG